MLQARSEIMGWTNPAQGIVTYQVGGRDMNLISQYGQIICDELKLQSEKSIGSTMETRSVSELHKTMT
jgi:hypothetical protein